MALRYLTYDTEGIPEGDRIPILNGSDPTRFDSLKELKAPINQNTNNIAGLDSEVQALKNNENTNETQIVDNTRRINNLEDRTLDKELLYALDLASIKVTFVNSTRIEIQHNRKEIYMKKVMAYVGSIGDTENYEDVTKGVKITEQLTKGPQGNIVNKKVIIETTTPLTGYAVIL
jgi:septal ring factor EnvC (AmiA/AmiB activator)